MTNYDYLIIGGGMTAAAAVAGVREVDAAGKIGLISMEPDAPYDRPPLSKAHWKGKPLDIIWRKTENAEVKIHFGRVAKEIVPKQKRSWMTKGIFSPIKIFCWPRAAGHDASHSVMNK